MHQKLFILDFGSQYTQLIARRVREQNVFCEINRDKCIQDIVFLQYEIKLWVIMSHLMFFNHLTTVVISIVISTLTKIGCLVYRIEL